MKMRKTLLAIFASLSMVITMIPLSTVMVSADTTYDFTLYYSLADEQLHVGSLKGSVFDEASRKWEGKGSTLTLNRFNFTTSAGKALVVPAGTTINLQNDNFIVSTPSSDNSTGIDTTQNVNQTGLTFEGNGDLTISTNNSNNVEIVGCYGIRNDFGETIFNGGGAIKATGGKAVEESMGILSSGKVTVSSGIVEATAGEVTGEHHASNGITIDNGGIEVSSGKLTAKGGSAKKGASNGAYTNGDITVSAGELTAIGGSKVDKSYGVFANGDITVSGGKLTATGGDCIESIDDMQFVIDNSYSMGIALRGYDFDKGFQVMNGGTVTTTSGNAEKSYGIYTPIFNFENGTVEAKASKDALESVGIFGFNTRIRVKLIGGSDSVININNKGLTAQGKTVALYSGTGNVSENNAANIKDGIYTVGSTNYDGSNPVEYEKTNNSSYKYVSTKTKEESPTPSPNGSTNGDENTDSAADTGDSINLAIPIGLAIAALLTVAALIITRRINIKK